MNNPSDRIRRLTQVVFISGTLNILLLGLLFYWVIRDRPPAPYFELKPADLKEQQAPLAMDRSNAEMLRNFRTLSFEQLVDKLTNTQLVENGYTQRDLALACLTAWHHFDLAKVVLPEQQRVLVFGRHRDGTLAEITAYPGLSDQQFTAIIHYANTEKWPLTSKGLYLKLRQLKGDASLVDAFLLTPEFLAVEMLFNRSGVTVEKSTLLNVLYEGNWQLLSFFSEQQRAAQDLSPARRQKFLLDYVESGSKSAAYLMLKTDGDFAAHKLDDRHVLLLLRLLDEKTPEAEKFALSQLTSPRSNVVWKTAAKRLYDFAGETPPEKYEHHAALDRFVRKNSSTITLPLAVPKKSKLYIVQEGDSLWKIARRYKVDINKLRQANRLQSDNLKPGTPLKIPEK